MIDINGNYVHNRYETANLLLIGGLAVDFDQSQLFIRRGPGMSTKFQNGARTNCAPPPLHKQNPPLICRPIHDNLSTEGTSVIPIGRIEEGGKKDL